MQIHPSLPSGLHQFEFKLTTKSLEVGNNHSILINLSDVDGKAIDNAIEIRALGTNQAIVRTLDAIQDFIDGMVHCSLLLIILL